MVHLHGNSGKIWGGGRWWSLIWVSAVHYPWSACCPPPPLRPFVQTHLGLGLTSSLLRWVPRRSVIVVLQESITKTCWGDSLLRWESTISHGSRRPQTETVGAHQWEKQVISSRLRGMKPQRKDAAGRNCEHPNHPQPKPSPVQSSIGSVHQESDFTAVSKNAKTDHQPSPKSLSARNQPSSVRVQGSGYRLGSGLADNSMGLRDNSMDQHCTLILHWICRSMRKYVAVTAEHCTVQMMKLEEFVQWLLL